LTAAIGSPIDRVDGAERVTGRARYASEIPLPGIKYAAIVGATIASGRVLAVAAAEAIASDGVLAVLTSENLGRIASQPPLLPSLVGAPAPGETFFPMQDDLVHYAGQPVAMVVADSYERAQHAASLITVEYEGLQSVTTIDEGRDSAYEAERLFGGLMPGRSERGDVESALAQAEVRIDARYRCAANHHNAMEAPSTTAVWEEDRLTIYDSCMGIRAVQLTVAALLGIPLANIRVVAQFTGGGFGSKAMVWPHVTLAALAARHVRRPVKLMLTRPQMFTSIGQREEQEQQIALGATRQGRLVAIRHEKLSITSPFDDWAEPATGTSSQIYACPNFLGIHRLIRGNTMTPTFTRGPGETVGSFVLETAMDELAHEIGVDPVELRVQDQAPTDPNGNPWSSSGLTECLRRGADSFGWDRRAHEPRSRRDGDWLMGMGMAAAGYPIALFMPTQHARARVYADGSAVVETGTQEFGTGVGTMMTQVGADALGVSVDSVRFRAGDTDLPLSSSAVGSAGATMVSAAVHAAATQLRDELVEMAVGDKDSPLYGADRASVDVRDGHTGLGAQPDIDESCAELL
jgi:xanthine dehydrogenase YagR molybdenum-binding subunit